MRVMRTSLSTMKTFTVLLLLVVSSVSIPVFADELKGTNNVLAEEMMKTALGQERVQAFEGAMKDVAPDEQKKFWDLYKDYAVEKTGFDERRFKLMDQYMTNYLLLTKSQTRDLMDSWIGLQQDEFTARVKMFKKLSSKVSPLVGTRFYQVDDYVYAALKIKYMSQYPIFGAGPKQ